MQYYEYAWDPQAFGMEEHTWKKYIGAYKNLFPGGINPEPEIIRSLKSRTKLAGTQDITAAYIVNLIGEKIRAQGNGSGIDEESLRLILEQIQELSNLGEAEHAQILRRFVEDIQAGKINLSGSVDDVFYEWKRDKIKAETEAFAAEWGAEPALIASSLSIYSPLNPEAVPRLDEIIDTVDTEKAAREVTIPFLHIQELTDTLPQWMAEIKRKYDL